MYENLNRHDTVEGSSDRSFGLVFAAFFSIVSLAPLFHTPRGAVRWWSLVLAAVFLAVALFRPSALSPLNRLWTCIGLLLHKVATPLLMGLVFWTTVVPIGLVLRSMKKDVLRLSRNPKVSSYWLRRVPPGPSPDSMRNQF